MAVIKFRMWTGGNYPGLVGGTNAITGVAESQRDMRGEAGARVRERLEDAVLMTLEMEQGDTS